MVSPTANLCFFWHSFHLYAPVLFLSAKYLAELSIYWMNNVSVLAMFGLIFAVCSYFYAYEVLGGKKRRLKKIFLCKTLWILFTFFFC